jgi:hypothetical protein
MDVLSVLRQTSTRRDSKVEGCFKARRPWQTFLFDFGLDDILQKFTRLTVLQHGNESTCAPLTFSDHVFCILVFLNAIGRDFLCFQASFSSRHLPEVLTMWCMLQEETADLAEEDAKKAKKKEEEEDEEEEEEDDEDKEGKISNKKKKVRAVASPFRFFMYTPRHTLNCFHALLSGRGLVIRACTSPFRQSFDRGLRTLRFHVAVLAKTW